MHPQNTPDQRSATEQIARSLAETTALSGGDAALIVRAAEALAATTTEWGVREPGGRTSAQPSRDEAEAWIADPEAWLPDEVPTLVSREVTEWREVTP